MEENAPARCWRRAGATAAAARKADGLRARDVAVDALLEAEAGDEGEARRSAVLSSWHAAKALGRRAGLAALGSLSLRGVSLGPTLSAALADGLRGADALASLDVAATKCRDAGALHLVRAARQLPSLESFDLAKNGLTDAAAASLSGTWPALVALVLHGNAFADTPPEPRSDFLETLDLDGNALGARKSPGVNALAAWLKAASTLHALKLAGNALSMRHVERLLSAALEAPELRTLDLRGAHARPNLVRSVAHRTRFTRLDVLLRDPNRDATPSQ